ncbi:zinc finger protein 69 homolog [Anopheles arabiensis]|uniref:Uncharacterized protein n=1 Tax=Anopheles arabiensis TaxID=7173 RepID=A0A499FTI9_ANOAR|nr:zinc finger protein 69 homolog [Anopheles arabiensis]
MHPAIQCRVCATSDVGCILVNIFDKHGQHESVADMLLELADVTAAEDDQFPHHCCTQCHQDLVQAVTVRRKCIESEKLLRICIESGYSNEQYDDNQFDNLSVASSDREDSTLGKSPFYHCCECGTDFFDSDTLQNHYESMHANAVHGWESFGISEISLYDSTDDEVEDTPSKDSVPYEDKGIPHRCCGCKPYACSLCEHRFKLLLYLNRHMKWHRGVYTCKQCGLRVKSASSLSNHMASHTGIQQYSCSICCSKYRYKESLKKHLRRKHGRSTRRRDRSE